MVRLLRAQPPRLAAAASATPSGDLLPELLADDDALAGFEEGRLFGGEWLRSLGMIPNEYLYYFYYGADTVEAIRAEPAPRGAFLLEQQAALLRRRTARRPAEALAAWRATRARARAHLHGRGAQRRRRSPASTTTAATAAATRARRWRVVEAIALNTRAMLILNTANRSALPFLDERAVVEVPCVVGRAGPVPVAVGDVPDARAGARRDDQGRRAHDDRGGADRLARARGQGARAAPAGAVGHHRARDLRRLLERLPALAAFSA